jgi:Flp pilus assembly protein protease CpaA
MNILNLFVYSLLAIVILVVVGLIMQIKDNRIIAEKRKEYDKENMQNMNNEVDARLEYVRKYCQR